MSMILPHFFGHFGKKCTIISGQKYSNNNIFLFFCNACNFWESSAKICTTFRRCLRKIEHIFVLLQCMRFRRKFAQFLGDFGEKLIPITITYFCSFAMRAFFGRFRKKIAQFLEDFGKKLRPLTVIPFSEILVFFNAVF